MHILYTLPFHSRLIVSFVAFIVSLIHCNTIGVARIFDWGAQILKNSAVFTEIESDFSGRNRKFERFFHPKSGDLQKKKKTGLHQN